MCGIVGYIGNKEAKEFLINGLHRLEYRGYDSAGIVTFNTSGKASLHKSKGKVEALEKLVGHKKSSDGIGIGHTRWATHGEPSKTNAHPHRSGDIYLVHNGIIENYKELKKSLKNHKFVSQTDTEVLAALVDSFYDDDTSLVDAVSQAIEKVVGTYGVAVVSARKPDEIVVARLGSPLIIGLGKEANYVASDASALLGYTDKAIYLNDGELAVCTDVGVSVRNLSSQIIDSKPETIETDAKAIQKQGYDHFLLKEICEQPHSLEATLRGRIDSSSNDIRLDGLNLTDSELRGVKHIIIVGCGTAYYAGLLSMYYLEQLTTDVTIEVVMASEFRYRSFNLPAKSLALIVSQSGETADTLACLREVKRRGARTLGIVNVVGSTIAREVDGGIYIHAGPEISVASTKAFTSQVAAMVMFSLRLAQVKGADFEIVQKYLRELNALPEQIKKVIKSHQDEIKKIAKKYHKYQHAFYFGRDTLYPVAMEGALKLKEISYIQAEGYAAGELKHGPIALVDDNFFEVALLLDNWLFDKSLSAVAEVGARGGHIIAITDSDKDIEAETTIRVKTDLKILSPIVLNIIQQLLAYYMALSRGTDVDQPRNLAKSVTVE